MQQETQTEQSPGNGMSEELRRKTVTKSKSRRLKEHETREDEDSSAASRSEGEEEDGPARDQLHPEHNSQEVAVERSPLGRFVRFNRKLGSGSHKSVYLGFDADTGKEVAWNVISLKEMDNRGRKRINEEISMLKSLKHPRIIAFINAWINKKDNQVCFITERVTGGSLLSYIRRIGAPLKLKVMRSWCRQILEGLEHLHGLKDPIIHRDLKCDNIFINGSVGEVLIGDLGLSTTLKQSCATSIVGTPDFIAPEIYEEKYGTAVDIYAFGMCLLEMVSQGSPYMECNSAAQIYMKVIHGEKPIVLRRIKDEQLRNLVESCIDKDAKSRPKAGDLHHHDWFADNEATGNNICELIPEKELPDMEPSVLDRRLVDQIPLDKQAGPAMEKIPESNEERREGSIQVPEKRREGSIQMPETRREGSIQVQEKQPLEREEKQPISEPHDADDRDAAAASAQTGESIVGANQCPQTSSSAASAGAAGSTMTRMTSEPCPSAQDPQSGGVVPSVTGGSTTQTGQTSAVAPLPSLSAAYPSTAHVAPQLASLPTEAASHVSGASPTMVSPVSQPPAQALSLGGGNAAPATITQAAVAAPTAHSAAAPNMSVTTLESANAVSFTADVAPQLASLPTEAASHVSGASPRTVSSVSPPPAQALSLGGGNTAPATIAQAAVAPPTAHSAATPNMSVTTLESANAVSFTAAPVAAVPSVSPATAPAMGPAVAMQPAAAGPSAINAPGGPVTPSAHMPAMAVGNVGVNGTPANPAAVHAAPQMQQPASAGLAVEQATPAPQQLGQLSSAPEDVGIEVPATQQPVCLLDLQDSAAHVVATAATAPAVLQQASQGSSAVAAETGNNVLLTSNAQVAAQTIHHGASNLMPGRALASPKLTVTGVIESATMQPPEDLLPGISSSLPQSSIPDEEIHSALASIEDIVVTNVIMTITQNNTKFNVAFDFDKRTDTCLGIAKELLDAKIVPQGIAMEDLMDDIGLAVVKRCRILANPSIGTGAPYSPEREDHGLVSDPAVMPDKTDAAFRETVQSGGDGMVPSAGLAPSKQVFEQQSMSSQQPLPDSSEVPALMPDRTDAAFRETVQSGGDGIVPSAGLASSKQVFERQTSLQLPLRDSSGVPHVASANSLEDSAAPREDMPPGDKTSPYVHPDGEELVPHAQCKSNVEGTDDQGVTEANSGLDQPWQSMYDLRPNAELADQAEMAVHSTSAPELASDTVEEERRWVALGWAKAESKPQVLAEALKKNPVPSDDPVPREHQAMLQRSLAYLIPEVNVVDFRQIGVWCEATSKAVSSFQKYHSLSSETGITEEKFWEKVSDQVKQRDDKEEEKKAKREADRKRSQQVREQRKQEQDRESAKQLEQMMGNVHANLHPAPAKSEEPGVVSSAANAAPPAQQTAPPPGGGR